jgi:hypothetical protein
MLKPLALLALVLALVPAASCESYKAPPEPTIVGVVDGIAPDPRQLDIHFSEAIDPSTLHLKVAVYLADIEGNLADEPGAVPGTPSQILFQHDAGAAETGGAGELLEGNTVLRITPEKPFPVGPRLILLIEPGLKGVNGVDTVDRRRTLFGYSYKCSGKATSGPFVSGIYFFVVDVDKPVGTQIQLLGNLTVDAATGSFVGQFTNADRLANAGRCPSDCGTASVCRLLPAPECVPPSTKAATPDEYPDFFANNSPPLGYSFPATGCAEQQAGGTVTFNINPTDADVTQPVVFIRGIHMSASFAPDAQGLLRGSGSFTADQTLLSTKMIETGPAAGKFTALLIPAGNAPKDVPGPDPSLKAPD